MPLDPSIILGAKAPQFDLAQFSPINTLMTAMKFKQLDQEGELNALTLKERKNLQTFMSENPDLSKPETRYKLASQFGETGRKIATSVTDIGKSETEEAKRRNELVLSKTNLYRDALRDVNDQRGALKWLQTQQQDPDMANSPVTKVSIMDAARAIPADPAGFADWKNKAALGLSEYIKQNKPVTFAQDLGPTGRILSRGGLGGEATVVPGSEYTKGKTFADLTAERQASTSAGQLGLAQRKFAWEQANPGYEIKEAEDGSIVGVNKRTLQAFPVSLGGPAPAAAPTEPMVGTGMPGARAPAAGAVVPAIPGMTSVLDQRAPATAPVAGAPLMGKGTAMTETQSNAAMFGGAMNQAQNTIKELEKSGTVRNAVVPGLLTGLAQLVPFGVGENMGNVIQSTFNADPTGLVGPNAAQQKLAQAQLAFATAYLRKTSGAAFGASEVANTIKEFFPLVGEGEKVIAQKAAARDRAIEGMKISTNKEGRKYIENYGGGSAPAAAGGGGGAIPNATATNPLGLTLPGVRR
jgi:hypothetical protein